VESHVLERSKIQYGFPILKERFPFKPGKLGPEGVAGGPEPDLVLEGDPHDPSTYPEIEPPGTEILPKFEPPVPNVEIIDTAPPTPGGAGIDGGVDPRVTTYGWKFNHAPVNNLQSTNATWWKLRAERYNSAFSDPATIIYTKQSTQKALQRTVYRGRVARFGISFSGDY